MRLYCGCGDWIVLERCASGALNIQVMGAPPEIGDADVAEVAIGEQIAMALIRELTEYVISRIGRPD